MQNMLVCGRFVKAPERFKVLGALLVLSTEILSSHYYYFFIIDIGVNNLH